MIIWQLRCYIDQIRMLQEDIILDCKKKQSEYDWRKFFFTNTVVNIWNFLPDVVHTDTVNCFKSRLDKFWSNQELIYNFRAEICGTGSRSEVVPVKLSTSTLKKLITRWHRRTLPLEPRHCFITLPPPILSFPLTFAWIEWNGNAYSNKSLQVATLHSSLSSSCLWKYVLASRLCVVLQS